MFSSSKKLEILDIPDTVTLEKLAEHEFYPRVRIPYCSSDSTATKITDHAKTGFSCELWESANWVLVMQLTNCLIPANALTADSYRLKVYATYSGNTNMNTEKVVWINTKDAPLEISYISGANRVFDVEDTISLTATVNLNATKVSFVWYCTDLRTWSPCFSVNYQYISLVNNQSMSVPKGLFFPDQTYRFKVIATDGSTTDSREVDMIAAPAGEKVINVGIIGEVNTKGYLDFKTAMNAFKA